MGELVHVSKVKVYKEPGKGKVKKAYIEGFPEPILTGVHGGIKKFYGVESGEDLPATLDYLVAALGSCLTGTLAGALFPVDRIRCRRKLKAILKTWRTSR
jgi:hypothetical protein